LINPINGSQSNGGNDNEKSVIKSLIILNKKAMLHTNSSVPHFQPMGIENNGQGFEKFKEVKGEIYMKKNKNLKKI
jgi:hypothetical protein